MSLSWGAKHHRNSSSAKQSLPSGIIKIIKTHTHLTQAVVLGKEFRERSSDDWTKEESEDPMLDKELRIKCCRGYHS